MRTILPTLGLSLAMVCLASVAEARWFTLGTRKSALGEIAQTLVAAPDGSVREEIPLTRPPAPPAPPRQILGRKHDPALTAEAAKSAAFSGPGERTALVEVGLEANNAKAADLMPDSGSTPTESTDEDSAAPATQPSDEAPLPAAGAGVPVAPASDEKPFVFP